MTVADIAKIKTNYNGTARERIYNAITMREIVKRIEQEAAKWK